MPCKYGRQAYRKCIPSYERQNAPARTHTRNPQQVQTSRARLMDQLTYPDDKYSLRDYRRSFRNYPTYAVTSTSHGLKNISTYPVQSLRWNPFVETSSFDDYRTDYYDDLAEKCSCENCACLATVSCSPLKTFGENIMQISDQYTMTPRLVEVGCGYDAVPRTRESQISVTGSDFIVRDPITSLHAESYCSRNYPPPILKKLKEEPSTHDLYGDRGYNLHNNLYAEEDSFETNIIYEEAEKDTHHEINNRVSSVRPCSMFYCNSKKEVVKNRKNLYNEGISDTITNRYPSKPAKTPACFSLRKNWSRESVNLDRERIKVDVIPTPGIPYSHRSKSRYHQCCKEPESKEYHYDDDENYTISTGLIMKAPISLTRYRAPSKLPRRVLTSERDIDAFLDTSYTNVPTKNTPSITQLRP